MKVVNRARPLKKQKESELADRWETYADGWRREQLIGMTRSTSEIVWFTYTQA